MSGVRAPQKATFFSFLNDQERDKYFLKHGLVFHTVFVDTVLMSSECPICWHFTRGFSYYVRAAVTILISVIDVGWLIDWFQPKNLLKHSPCASHEKFVFSNVLYLIFANFGQVGSNWLPYSSWGFKYFYFHLRNFYEFCDHIHWPHSRI